MKLRGEKKIHLHHFCIQTYKSREQLDAQVLFFWGKREREVAWWRGVTVRDFSGWWMDTRLEFCWLKREPVRTVLAPVQHKHRECSFSSMHQCSAFQRAAVITGRVKQVMERKSFWGKAAWKHLLFSYCRALLPVTAWSITKHRNSVNTRLRKVYKGILKCEKGTPCDLQERLRREL